MIVQYKEFLEFYTCQHTKCPINHSLEPEGQSDPCIQRHYSREKKGMNPIEEDYS
jgi:hypothetical protein